MAILIFTFEEWHDKKVNSLKEVKCPDCDGNGEIEEEVLSSQCNWHTIYDPCERCDGNGKINPSKLRSDEKVFDRLDYVSDQVEIIRALASWKRISFFDALCDAKGLFNE